MNKVWLFFLSVILIFLMYCGVVEKLANKDPIINGITANPVQIGTLDTTTLRVEAEDPDEDKLSFRWDSNSKGQFISATGEEVKWIAPDYSNRFRIEVKVKDENGGDATGEIYVNVRGDESPIVTITQPVENEIIPGLGMYTIKAEVVFDWPIERVDFFMDEDSMIYSDGQKPYDFAQWDVTGLSGEKVIKAKAFESGNESNFGVDSVHVFIEGIVPVPKTPGE